MVNQSLSFLKRKRAEAIVSLDVEKQTYRTASTYFRRIGGREGEEAAVLRWGLLTLARPFHRLIVRKAA